jgi:hypothetical protein
MQKGKKKRKKKKGTNRSEKGFPIFPQNGLQRDLLHGLCLRKVFRFFHPKLEK